MIQKIFTTTSTSVLMLLLPVMAFATSDAGPYFGKVDTLFTNLIGFIDSVLIPFVFTLALLIFIWGMFRFFVWGQANEEDRSKGRQMILWSIIGMMFMVSIWGIVNIFADGIFGTVTGSGAPKLPGTPTL